MTNDPKHVHAHAKTHSHNQVKDSCDTCGSFVDIGTVIEAQDTELMINLKGVNAKQDAQLLVDKATARFKSAKASMKASDEGVILALNFEYTVEKMIFQLEEQLT